jgi:prepilin signal peptidase PulO-like enzyme (type II secretory pathway)
MWASASVAGAGVAAAAAVVFDSPTAGAAAAMVLGGTAVGWSDSVWRRIPNAVVLILVLFAFATAVLSSAVSIVEVAMGGAFASVALLGLHLVDPRWVGFGDVKLSFAVGALLGVTSWPLGLAALWLASFAAVVSRPFVPIGWRRSVPFGFWLAVAAVPVSIYSAIWVVQ